MCTFGPDKTFCLHIIDIGRVIYKSDILIYGEFSSRVMRTCKKNY